MRYSGDAETPGPGGYYSSEDGGKSCHSTSKVSDDDAATTVTAAATATAATATATTAYRLARPVYRSVTTDTPITLNTIPLPPCSGSCSSEGL